MGNRAEKVRHVVGAGYKITITWLNMEGEGTRVYVLEQKGFNLNSKPPRQRMNDQVSRITVHTLAIYKSSPPPIIGHLHTSHPHKSLLVPLASTKQRE